MINFKICLMWEQLDTPCLVSWIVSEKLTATTRRAAHMSSFSALMGSQHRWYFIRDLSRKFPLTYFFFFRNVHQHWCSTRKRDTATTLRTARRVCHPLHPFRKCSHRALKRRHPCHWVMWIARGKRKGSTLTDALLNLSTVAKELQR